MQNLQQQQQIATTKKNNEHEFKIYLTNTELMELLVFVRRILEILIAIYTTEMMLLACVIYKNYHVIHYPLKVVHI